MSFSHSLPTMQNHQNSHQNSADSFQSKIQAYGEDILKRIEAQPKASLFSKDFWYGSVMDWSMKNEKFKTNMFRFVDVLPSLTTGEEVATHLKEYFSEGGKTELPAIFEKLLRECEVDETNCVPLPKSIPLPA